jgi:hypothetical protein
VGWPEKGIGGDDGMGNRIWLTSAGGDCDGDWNCGGDWTWAGPGDGDARDRTFGGGTRSVGDSDISREAMACP